MNMSVRRTSVEINEDLLTAVMTEEQEHQEGEVLRRFGRLRARMAKASAGLSEEEVAAEVEAARAELEA